MYILDLTFNSTKITGSQSISNNIDCVEMYAKRKADKNDMLTDIETKKHRTLIGQLSWIAYQTRPDLSFDFCELGSVADKGIRYD